MKKNIILLFLILSCSFSSVNAAVTSTLQNVDAKSYKDFLLQRYVVKNGFTVQIPNEYTMIFSKVLEHKGAVLALKFFAGSKIGGQIVYQFNYTIIPSGNMTTVQLAINGIMDHGSPLSKVVPLGTDQEINELNLTNNEFIGSVNK